MSIEEKRADKTLGSSLEASLKIKLNKKKLEIVKNIDLAELCITSLAQIEESDQEDIIVETAKAEGNKCSVCWKISNQPCERHG